MKLSAIDLNLLVALDRLLRHRSVTSAAREVGVSQPAMSRTLGRLRDVFEDPLFVRVGRELSPTPRALALAAPVEAALRAAENVFSREEAFDPATERGTFTLALGDETQRAFGECILTMLWESMPGLDVRLRRLSATSIAEARRGEVDLALAPDLDVLPPSAGGVSLSEYVALHVYDRRFVVVWSEAHPRPRWTLRRYANATHVVAGPDASGRGFVDDLLEGHGLSRRVAAAVTSFDTAAELVSRTSLIAVLPDDVVQTSGVAVHSAPPPLPVPVLPMLLLWHPRHTVDPRHRFVRGQVATAIRARLDRSK